MTGLLKKDQSRTALAFWLRKQRRKVGQPIFKNNLLFTVKEIAYELGYDDEYYFSRVFKVKTEISPQIYRETIGFNKGAS